MPCTVLICFHSTCHAWTKTAFPFTQPVYNLLQRHAYCENLFSFFNPISWKPLVSCSLIETCFFHARGLQPVSHAWLAADLIGTLFKTGLSFHPEWYFVNPLCMNRYSSGLLYLHGVCTLTATRFFLYRKYRLQNCPNAWFKKFDTFVAYWPDIVCHTHCSLITVVSDAVIR